MIRITASIQRAIQTAVCSTVFLLSAAGAAGQALGRGRVSGIGRGLGS